MLNIYNVNMFLTKIKDFTMKNVSFLSVLAILTVPAFAQETKIQTVSDTVDVVEQNESVVAEQYAQQFEQPKMNTEQKSSNPKIRFPHGLQLGVGVSPSSGLNGFVGYNNKNFESFWWKRFGFRFDFASYSPIKSRLNKKINSYVGDEGIEIDDNLKVNNARIDAKHMGAIIDFYPFGDTWFLGGLRVSGGYMKGDLELKADIHGTKKIGNIEFELGGRKYSYDGNEMKGTAQVNWKYSGPYVGTGFDLGIFRGFKLFLDAGVVFADNHAKVDLDVPLDDLKDITVPGDVISIVENSTNPIVQNAYNQYIKAKQDALSDAQKELDKVDYYPIVKLGFMYRF